MELHVKVFKSDEHSKSTLHFIETSSSLFHNAPYINTVVKSGESLKQMDIPLKDNIHLVYGLQGNMQFINCIHFMLIGF